ncbi:MAG TPA: 2-succinyl-5-enolpyruvyl-6-hydroxy-3-cyclohexene-1-carboxylic-acid synthase [Acidimicrobiales bacterium]|nr:2-succinyl-5-enolpyruvyl-6-hydroxy-3-cyclohexene-1-carboxylic-acid synthase [Acidimicrobiales bacterium]
MTLPVTPQAAFAATLVDEWLRAGVTDVVLAPGSRSTPLALAVDAAPLRLHVHLDERSAGFFALGLALRTGRPAPVVVTSGTAAVELHAAVVEAHHSRVPLIVCTADRPVELHDVEAPQTIEQRHLYGTVLRWQLDLGSVADLPASAWRSVASRSVAAATTGPLGPGPVQLNLGFRDPLVASPGDLVPPGRPDGAPWHAVHAASPPELPVLASFAGRRGVIVAGAGAPAGVASTAAALGWPVLAAPASGCRSAPGAVTAFDAILRHGPTAARLRPDIIVRAGGAPASKVLAAWAAGVPEQVVVDPYGVWGDPERTATAFVRAGAGGAPSEPAGPGWLAAWEQADAVAQGAITAALAECAEATEPGTARTVTRLLGSGDTLFVASSMPVRDVEWFGAPGMACRVLANRGANGIDGLVSTALGAAAGAGGGHVVALLGDLAFLHDGGGLLGAAARGIDCCVVVVDNDGGGIFSFLPQVELPGPQFERLWGTPHGVDLTALAAAHGIPAAVVTDAAGVAPAVSDARAAGGVRLVLVRTDRARNVEVHALLNAAVASALDEAHPSRAERQRPRAGPDD